MSARPRLFSWYVTKLIVNEVLGSFFLGTIIFLCIMLMFQTIRLSEFLVSHKVALLDVAKMATSLLISFLPVAVPVAFLFSVLMGISRANSEGEILALQVAGFSPYRIFMPLGGMAIIVAMVSVYLSMFLVPRANRSFELRVGRIDSERVIANLKPGVFMHGFYGLVVMTEEVNRALGLMKRVFIYDHRDLGTPLAITAMEGSLVDYSDNSLRTLRLRNGYIYVEKPWSGGNQQIIKFNQYDINLETGEAGGVWRDFSAPSYTLPHLKQRIHETSGDLTTHRRLQIELHRRYSLALSVLAFAVMGFAVGCRSQRGVRSGAIVLCLVVGLIYWLAYVAATALAATGWLLPWLGIWLPNFLLLGYGLWGFRRLYQ